MCLGMLQCMCQIRRQLLEVSFLFFPCVGPGDTPLLTEPSFLLLSLYLYMDDLMWHL